MKTRLLIIITGIFAGTGMMMFAFDDDYNNHNNAYGMWFPLSPEELIEQSRTIFVGTVIDVRDVDIEYSESDWVEKDGSMQEIVETRTITLDEYTISVEEYLKNPQDSDTMKVLRATVGGVPSGPARINGFEIGDRVLFYLPKDERQTHFANQYLPESFQIPKHCDAKTVLEKPKIIGANDFRMMQDGIALQNNFTANKKLQFVFDKDLRTLAGSGFTVDVVISKMLDKNEHQTILEESIHAESQPCEWIATAQWDFVPTAGEYAMWMSYAEGGDSGRSTSSTGFSVVEDKSIPLPLKLDDFASKLWYDHEFIIDGTILDIRGYDKPERVYDIQINSLFKPTESIGTKLITVYGSPNFYNIEGDRGIFFIKKEDVKWTFGRYAAKVTPECSPELMYHYPKLTDPPLYHGGPARPLDFTYAIDCYPSYYQKYLPQYMKAHGATEFPSPHTQAINGVLVDEIVCNGKLEVVIRYNGSPVCVKHETISKLIERGWAENPYMPTIFE